MKQFRGRLAVITGGGSGMGRELARQLSAEGCHVATCDLAEPALAETRRLCEQAAPPGTRVTVHRCDVADERQVLVFRDEVLREHSLDHVHLLFNNAGIGGGGSLFADPREAWERTFNICWFGVYYCTRAFLPLLVAAPEGRLVNTSSVNGFWASLGAGVPHTAYSSAKFAVKGFTEALITDLRLHAPHVGVSLVMPGHIGTPIMLNSAAVLGRPRPADMSADDVALLRKRLHGRGLDVRAASDDMLRALAQRMAEDFRDKAPVTAAEAARIILDGVRAGRWRILIGADAEELDRMVRADPDRAYEPDFHADLQAKGHFTSLLAVRKP